MATPKKEPGKYAKDPKTGRWVITAEWKEWNVTKGKTPKEKPNLTLENHVPVWRLTAHSASTGKKIYFCYCLKTTTCGAVGTQSGRSSEIVQVVPPKFAHASDTKAT